MKILISENLNKNMLNEIQKISPKIEVYLLRIKTKENIMCKAIIKFSEYFLNYNLYKMVVDKMKCSERYIFYINNEMITKPYSDIDVLLAPPDINKEMFSGLMNYLPELKWIHSSKTGVDHLASEALSNSNITLTSSKGIHSARIAEFVLTLVLYFSKKLYKHSSLQKERKWGEVNSADINGKILGVLGAGSIGKKIAERAKLAGMRVIGFDSTDISDQNFDLIYKNGQLETLLAQCDFVVNCLPLTPETKMLLGSYELRSMKRTAYLINISRGEVIDEESLAYLLYNNTIAGAAIDVVSGNYLPRNHPLYKCSNLILTHYSAYGSKEAINEIVDRFIYNVNAFINKKPLTGIIDKRRWF